MSSFGEELKRERELRRITLREVADATKINLRYLEALDKNDFKHLPGGVFNRGFVRAYAQFIGVDADQMVSAYIMEETAQSTKGGGEPGTETLLRGAGSSIAHQNPSSLNEGSGKWFKLALAVLVVAVLIAAGLFVVLKFVGDADSGVEAERTDLPKTGNVPAVSAAAVSTEDGTQRTPPVAKPEPPAETPQAATNPATRKAEDTVVDRTRREVDEPEAASTAAAKAPAIAGGIVPSTTAAALPGTLPANAEESIQATIYIDRATSGRLNCDNRQIDLLNGMPPGTRFELSCSAFLIVDADDGGALRIGWPGFAPASPGETGVPLAGHRIDVRSLSARAPAENRP